MKSLTIKLGTVLLLSASICLTACKEATTPETAPTAAANTDSVKSAPTTDATKKTAVAAAPTNAAPLPSPPAMTTLSGNSFDFATYEDRLILINVWATWCAPCRIEMPDLEELQGKYDSSQFQIVGVAADETTAVAEYLQTINVTYPNYIGDPDAVFSWSQALGNRIVGVPFSAIIDTNGAVRWTKMGGRIHAEELQPVIDELIKEVS